MPITLNGDTGITTPSYGGAVTAEYLVPVTGFKNRIINGDMTIDQRNAGASVTPTDGQYLLDRWLVEVSQTSKLSVQQNAGSVTPPAGFTNYFGATSLSAYSIVASDYFTIEQRIEGFNLADLGWGTANAVTVTLSFWVRSSLTGTFGGSLVNSGNSRSYPFTYTISAANTWEQKTITVAGDTSGTWLRTNGIGMIISLSLGMGSTRSGTAGAWAAGNFLSSTGATSVVGTNGATLYITGVQLEKGSTATSFDYLPFGTELMLCQRYCEAIVAGGTNSSLWPIQAGSTTNSRGGYSFKVQKRASPSFTNLIGTNYICQYTTGNFVPSAVNLAASNASGILIDSVCTGLTPGQAGFVLEGTVSNGATICLFIAEL